MKQIKPGTRLQDGNKVFQYTGSGFLEIQQQSRRVEHRLFLDNKGCVRCWTSDWMTSHDEMFKVDYFQRWLSLKSATVVNAPEPYEICNIPF